ncbi:synaptotagmin-16-like isoform X4 [Acipenser oxyrinchus oxyrinchus]|uniref:Synaptotagmin-16-like isoform X4 n=1 Tax=Acipenser oxyrinchus oxyrinchus TaxID=40147 RepID=A0AAD8CH91_ACIOX|nr:synaptotagmin-16-like isoform X4 [Acipenser oxyrinchus oxyrinchus]
MAADITPEAIGFLSAVGVFIVLLAVLFLFINKKLCFEKIVTCRAWSSEEKETDQGKGWHSRGTGAGKLIAVACCQIKPHPAGLPSII